MPELAIPFLAGLGALIISHTGHFAWNYWRAGDRIALDDERTAKVTAEKERDQALTQLAQMRQVNTGPAGPAGPMGPPGLGLPAWRAHITASGETTGETGPLISSVRDEGVGIRIISWVLAFASLDYDIFLTPIDGGAIVDQKTAGAVRIRTYDYDDIPKDIDFGILVVGDI